MLKRRLQEFISRDGKEEFRQLLQKQVTFVDLLVAFENLNIKLDVLTYLRRLQRRWYSIANYIDYRGGSKIFSVYQTSRFGLDGVYKIARFCYREIRLIGNFDEKIAANRQDMLCSSQLRIRRIS
mgnify:CR=1 FL=1